MNNSNSLDAVPDVSLETRLITIENQCVVALATGESHDHCVLPHDIVGGQWSALFEQPYDKVSRAKGIRLTDCRWHLA